MDLTPIINALPPEVWLAVFGGVVSVITQAAKNWLELQSPKVIMTLTATLSTIAAVVPALLTAVSHDPTVLGTHAVYILGAATLLYRYVIQPSDSFLKSYKEFKATQATNNVPTDLTAPVTPPVAAQLEPATISTNEFIG